MAPGQFDLFAGWTDLDDLANLPARSPARAKAPDLDSQAAIQPFDAANMGGGAIPVTAPQESTLTAPATPIAGATPILYNQAFLEAVAASQLRPLAPSASAKQVPATPIAHVSAHPTAAQPVIMSTGRGGSGGSNPPPPSANSLPPDTPPVQCCDQLGDLSQIATGSDGSYDADRGYGDGNIRFFDGEIRLVADDLSSAGFGTPWGVSRTYANLYDNATTPAFGSGMADSQQPYLINIPAGPSNPRQIIVVTSSINAHYFDQQSNGSFLAHEYL